MWLSVLKAVVHGPVTPLLLGLYEAAHHGGILWSAKLFTL